MTECHIHRYNAPILFFRGTRMQKHFIPIPDDIVEWLRRASTRRLIVLLNGHVYRRVRHSIEEIGPCLFMSRDMLRDVGVEHGDMVLVELEVDPNPDHVEICEEFRVALELDVDAGKRFYSMTSGRQRSLAHYANVAKRVETRIKRSLELAYKLRTRTLHSD
ncbi:MAG TPA: YdeI/OmpD-associated family protein [Rhodothermales bacterium]|nr:YdeI/OmpD-associated family protein [Rhodothermales bacterium]